MNLSEAISIFSDHAVDIRKACIENAQAIAAAHQPAKAMTDDDAVTIENIWGHVNYLAITQKTEPLLRTINRIDGRKRHVGGQSITDSDINRAKEYPIKELWTELVGTPIKGGMSKCCFHNDNTASMSLRRYNRYHCFGCDEKGSVIDLYMKVQGVDFITAVKKLI